MSDVIYKLIGKAVVTAGVFFVKARYGRHLRIAGGIAVIAAGIAAYIAASRDVEEG